MVTDELPRVGANFDKEIAESTADMETEESDAQDAHTELTPEEIEENERLRRYALKARYDPGSST